MFKKQVKKAMAVVISIAIMQSILPAAWTGSRVFAVAQPVDLSNSDFEAAQSIPGWNIEDGSGIFALSETVVYNGSVSLEMIDTGATQSPLIRSEMTSVSEGDTVSASCYANVASNGGSAYVDAIFSVWYCDADGNRIGQAYGPDITTNGGWTQYVTGDITVPAQAGGVDVAGVCIAIYGGGSTECDAYFDDIQLSVGSSVAEPVSLNNSDFETAQSIPNWTVEYDAGTLAISKEMVHSGLSSLEMIDTGATQSPVISSQRIPVAEGNTVSVSCYANIAAYDGSAAYVDAIFSVWYCDADGNRIGQAYGPDVGANGGWTQYTTGDITIPAQAGGNDVAGICVAFYGGGAAECKAYYDDIEVSVQSPVSLYNGDFETEQDIPGWIVEDGSGIFAISDEVVHNGSGALEMIDTGATQSPVISSEMIPVLAGDTISASCYANVAAYDGSAAYVDAVFSLWYCDADGNRIGQAYGPDNTANGGWTQYTTGDITVPAQVNEKDIAAICVVIYGAGGGECKAYFDDIELNIENAEGPELLPKKIFSCDCSNLSAMKNAGWTIDNPAQGVFNTDSTHSTGTTNPDKTVPEGQILFYMDSTSGVDASNHRFTR